MNLYNRVFRLRVGQSLDKWDFTLDNLTANEQQLNIQFTVDSTYFTNNYKRSQIRIYNLSQKNQDILAKRNSFIQLEAGYSNDLSVIFLGQIVNTLPQAEYNGSKFIELYCRTFSENSERLVNVSFDPNIKLNEIFKALSNESSIKIVYNSESEITFPNGWNFTGTLRRAVKQLCDSLGLIQSEENNIIYIYDIRQERKLSEIVITPETGLIGSPMYTSTGIEFNCAIRSDLLFKRRFRVESRFPVVTFASEFDVNQQFKTKSGEIGYLVYTGDFRGDVWQVNVKSVPDDVSTYNSEPQP